MSTVEIPLRADADRSVRELILELGRLEDAELRALPLVDPIKERWRAVQLRRRERQVVAELRRR